MMPLIDQRERAPAPRPIRWTARQRAAVVLAVASGRLAASEVERRYGISPDEFHDWQQRSARGLHVTSGDAIERSKHDRADHKQIAVYLCRPS